MQIKHKQVKNILCVRNDRFGEFLLNIPALRALKETFTDAKVTVVIDPYLKDLVEGIPLIDEVIEWSQGQHSFSEKCQLLKLLRKRHIDIAVMLNPSKEFNILTFLAGISLRVGYARKWDFLLNYKLEDKKYLGKMHEIEYNLELVGCIGAKTENKKLSLNIDSDIINSLFKDYNIGDNDILVALHPWTSDSVKQWPQENFPDLVRKLINVLNLKVIIIGGKSELNKSEELYNNIFKDINLINMTGKTTLKELGALLKRCKLLISGDSGPVHLACAVGIPVVAIFRNDIPGKTPQRWGPWGQGHLVIEKSNLCDITVDEVLSKTKEILKK